MSTGVTRADISGANYEIGQEIRSQSQLEASHVGNYQNQWQKPISEYGRNDPEWQVKLNASPFVGKIDVDASDWEESRRAIDAVMKLLLKELRSQAENYEGLRIDSYVRQGSSREGLKVLKADEFDAMLEFHFDGLESHIQPATTKNRNGYFIPGHCYLELKGVDLGYLKDKYPRLHAKSIFIVSSGKVYLSSKNLHTKVFQSMVDTAIDNINQAIEHHNRDTNQPSRFGLRRKMNPPSINVTISMKGGVTYDSWGNVKTSTDKELDLDFVPAFLLGKDQTTRYEGVLLECPIHAICKWAEEDSFKAIEFVDQILIWDIKSVGYERHILDVARRDTKKLYILTALRILKTYFVKTKEIARQSRGSPPQIVTVLKSYHLKQLAFYLLNYLCHKYPNFKVDGVQKALLYFFDILRIALTEKCLPHLFFSDNSVIGAMLPGYPPIPTPKLKFNMFRRIPNDSLTQALASLENHLIPNLGFGSGSTDDNERERVQQDFKRTVAGSDYF
ncbi:hypothetical protein MAR_022708 [Mya arenaria]|uniref:Mab-21-like nucleotidyltransferase domain-containing protein n=2 Tax=Mya arenaria TaxID=6604 RepID=A0ABY7DPP6_MYAAR|nr:hypothetical protein MAR_022708 [Mya arenaria]